MVNLILSKLYLHNGIALIGELVQGVGVLEILEQRLKSKLDVKKTCHVHSLRLHPVFDCFQIIKDKYRINLKV